MQNPMSKAEYDALDKELFEYNQVAREIAKRKDELRAQKDFDDENIGGGRSNRISKAVENEAISYVMDARISYLERLRKEVESCYKNLTSEQRQMFELRWLLNEGNNWEDIAHKMHFNKGTVSRKRKKILEAYAREKGKIS